jgi:DNA topoisomerase-1
VPHKLVIVESPAKARKIAEYLGSGYVVESSIGHIRDLPTSAADTPAKIKDQPWGRLAVDVDNGFEPYYVVPRDKKAHISKLKSLLKDAEELYLATDEDREGEAIAWHLLDELKPKGIPVKRMVFHEITKPAILAAADNPRDLDMDLVEAQEARRILDHAVGGRPGEGADGVPRRVLLGPRGHLRRRRRPRAADVPRATAQHRRAPGRPGG